MKKTLPAGTVIPLVVTTTAPKISMGAMVEELPVGVVAKRTGPVMSLEPPRCAPGRPGARPGAQGHRGPGDLGMGSGRPCPVTRRGPARSTPAVSPGWVLGEHGLLARRSG